MDPEPPDCLFFSVDVDLWPIRSMMDSRFKPELRTVNLLVAHLDRFVALLPWLSASFFCAITRQSRAEPDQPRCNARQSGRGRLRVSTVRISLREYPSDSRLGEAGSSCTELGRRSWEKRIGRLPNSSHRSIIIIIISLAEAWYRGRHRATVLGSEEFQRASIRKRTSGLGKMTAKRRRRRHARQRASLMSHRISRGRSTWPCDPSSPGRLSPWLMRP